MVERQEVTWKAVRFEIKGASNIQLATAVKRSQNAGIPVGLSTIQPRNSKLYSTPSTRYGGIGTLADLIRQLTIT